jgi:hypothetical protein
VTIEGETRDYARAVLLSRCGSSVFGRTADELEVNLGSLDAPDQLKRPTKADHPSGILAAAVPAYATIRAQSRPTGRFEE